MLLWPPPWVSLGAFMQCFGSSAFAHVWPAVLLGGGIHASCKAWDCKLLRSTQVPPLPQRVCKEIFAKSGAETKPWHSASVLEQ